MGSQYVVLRVRVERERRGASGSVVEYRLAKARVAGSNPVSRFTLFMRRSGCCRVFCHREKSLIYKGFFYVYGAEKDMAAKAAPTRRVGGKGLPYSIMSRGIYTILYMVSLSSSCVFNRVFE